MVCKSAGHFIYSLDYVDWSTFDQRALKLVAFVSLLAHGVLYLHLTFCNWESCVRQKVLCCRCLDLGNVFVE